MLWAMLSLTVVVCLVVFSLSNDSQFKYLVSTESTAVHADFFVLTNKLTLVRLS